MKHIVIINGSGFSGKDTLIDYVSNELAVFNKNVMNVSSIDIVRQACELLGCKGKEEKDRQFLSKIKQLSAEYYSHPITYMCKKISEFVFNYNDEILFLHIREPEEIDNMKSVIDICYGARKDIQVHTLLVTRQEVGIIQTNPSDANVLNYNYDYHITNDGTIDELRKQTSEWLLELIYGRTPITPRVFSQYDVYEGAITIDTIEATIKDVLNNYLNINGVEANIVYVPAHLKSIIDTAKSVNYKDIEATFNKASFVYYDKNIFTCEVNVNDNAK